MFFPPGYIIKVIKSLIFIALIFLFLLLLISTLSEKTNPDMKFWELIANRKQLIGFFVIFAVTYPLIAFIRKKVTLAGPFRDKLPEIAAMMDTLGYVQTKDDGSGILRFRLKNKFYRLMRLFFEDTVEMDYRENGSLTVSGLRKDAYRIARYIEYMNMPEK